MPTGRSGALCPTCTLKGKGRMMVPTQSHCTYKRHMCIPPPCLSACTSDDHHSHTHRHYHRWRVWAAVAFLHVPLGCSSSTIPATAQVQGHSLILQWGRRHQMHHRGQRFQEVCNNCNKIVARVCNEFLAVLIMHTHDLNCIITIYRS